MLCLTFVALNCGLFCSAARAQSARATAGEHWVGTWAASRQMLPEDAASANSADTGFKNQTVRMIVHVSIGGDELRVRMYSAVGH